MNQSPTDPVRAYLEAATELTLCDEENGSRDTWTTERALDVAKADFMESARNAIPSLSAMVAREEAVRALAAEWRKCTWGPYTNPADALEHIFPKEGAK